MHIIVTLFISSLAILALTHMLALEFYLYWTYDWLDMCMHWLGGITVVLGYSSLPFFGVTLPKRLTTLKAYILVALSVGILWELFEYGVGISLVGDEDFVLDTVSDLILDVIGGMFGYYLTRRIKDL